MGRDPLPATQRLKMGSLRRSLQSGRSKHAVVHMPTGPKEGKSSVLSVKDEAIVVPRALLLLPVGNNAAQAISICSRLFFHRPSSPHSAPLLQRDRAPQQNEKSPSELQPRSSLRFSPA